MTPGIEQVARHPLQFTAYHSEKASMNSNHSRGWMHATMCGIVLAAAVTATGCQVSVSGQTLPSPYYTTDDVQYFPAGSEHKLSREANLMEQYNTDRQMQGDEQP